MRYIHEGYGTSGRIAFTLDGNDILEGYKGTRIYKIRDNEIWDTYGDRIAFTIDGDYVRRGYRGDIAYTIDGSHILEGCKGSTVYTLE